MNKSNKKLLTTLLLLTTISPEIYALDEQIDPYKSIEHITLKNGLNVYLAPSEETNLSEIRLDVNVGWDAEDKANWGVSHLLEHVLFRDKQLKDEMSYLQIIKEAGGSANGSTSSRKTSYYGSIPSAKSQWLMDIFSKMILKPNMTIENVEKEKSTVELEIGRPGPVSLSLGFNPMDKIIPKYLRSRPFMETEFGIVEKNKFSTTDEQLSNRKLKLAQVSAHYNNYYYPSNMKLFVAGKFDRKSMLKSIEATWGKMPAVTGLKMDKLQDPIPRLAPFIKTKVSEGNNSVYIGTKAWNYTNQEQEVLSSYSKYLAHRLMKEIRNTKGQAYTAFGEDYFYKNYGYTYIGFETPKENFDSNLKLVQTYIHTQAENGNLKPEEVKSAVELHLASFHLKGREAKAMMEFAQDYDVIVDYYGEFTSPYESIKNIKPEEYNSILKKYFKPEHRYEWFVKSPIMFAYDYMLLFAVSLVLTFTGLRFLLTKEFKNDHIRWVRKVKFPPLKMLEFSAIVIGFMIYFHVALAMDLMIESSNFFQSHLLLSQYFFPMFSISLMIVTFQITLSVLPRKLMIMDDQFIIKSVSYYSKKIPLQDIESVEVSRALTYPFPMSKWISKIGLRYYNFSMKFWKKGLIVNLKNGKSYFFSMETAEDAHRELSRFVMRTEIEKIKETDIAA